MNIAAAGKSIPTRVALFRSARLCQERLALKSGGFKVWCSGCFFHSPGANAGGANSDVLPASIHDRVHAPKVWIPASPPRVVRVADHVSIARRFAAEFTLQCHISSYLGRQAAAKLVSKFAKLSFSF